MFREVCFEIDGQEYWVTPSNKLLRRIEGNGVTLAGISSLAQAGNPPISHVAYLIWAIVNSAGYEVSEDEIFGKLVSAPEGVAKTWALTAVQAFNPVVDEKKPAPKGTKSKAG